MQHQAVAGGNGFSPDRDTDSGSDERAGNDGEYHKAHDCCNDDDDDDDDYDDDDDDDYYYYYDDDKGEDYAKSARAAAQ